MHCAPCQHSKEKLQSIKKHRYVLFINGMNHLKIDEYCEKIENAYSIQ